MRTKEGAPKGELKPAVRAARLVRADDERVQGEPPCPPDAALEDNGNVRSLVPTDPSDRRLSIWRRSMGRMITKRPPWERG
jgi:hypothetical protein